MNLSHRDHFVNTNKNKSMAKAKRGFTFQKMQVVKPTSSKFNLSHNLLTTLGAGYLVPVFWTDKVPAGTLMKCNLSGFVRLLALSSPMFQREDIKVRAFKVPKRLLGDNHDFDKAYVGDEYGEHIDFPHITCVPGHMKVGSLYDYLNLPLPYVLNERTGAWEFVGDDVNTSPSVQHFAFWAYHRIYNDWFRNSETEKEEFDAFKAGYANIDRMSSDDMFGSSNYEVHTLHRVCWDRDYFTSALRSSQRGQQVTIPLVGSAPVKVESGGSPNEGRIVTIDPNRNVYVDDVNAVSDASITPEGDPRQLIVDGSEFTGIGAIALRTAMNLQAFLERNNIAGYRLIENILAHFGVQSSNKLLDYAEYLGGISAPITISAVDQTSATEEGGTPQGTQVGTGQSAFNNFLFKTFVEEPCVIMVVAYITAKSSYSQGLARQWTRKTYLDEYWPEFQTIGEQEIKNQELYFNFFATGDENDRTWAFQSRYAEYKYEPDRIAGDFRTDLSYWHQSRLFNELPAFNDQFVKSNPSSRVFALSDEVAPRKYLCDLWFDIQAVEPMSKYAHSKLW